MVLTERSLYVNLIICVIPEVGSQTMEIKTAVLLWFYIKQNNKIHRQKKKIGP